MMTIDGREREVHNSVAAQDYNDDFQSKRDNRNIPNMNDRKGVVETLTITLEKSTLNTQTQFQPAIVQTR